MRAARYIGRVGGLAVALGVGSAAFLGQGVAWADEGSSPPGASGQDNSAQGGHAGKAGVSGTDSKVTTALSGSAQSSGGSTTSPATPAERLARLGKVFSNGGALTSKRLEQFGITGGHQPKLADKAAAVAQTLNEANQDSVDAPASSSFAASVPETASPSSSLAANTFVAKAREWLASPAAVAGRAAAEPPGAVSSLPPTLNRPTEMVTAQTPANGAIAPTGVSNLLTSVVDDVLSPFAGTAPQREPADSPASWIMLAAARREIGIGSTTSDLVSIPTLSTSLLGTSSLTYTPTLGVNGGVITGIETPAGSQPVLSSRGYPLVYTVVTDPSQGGKINLNSTTGNFTYLPYATIVHNGSEDVGVMVSETTPLVAALAQLPLVGSFAQPVVIQLHQVPILGDALSPVIGSAAVVTVNLDPSQINTTANPIAYTYKVTSFDGTLISTNFFPASGAISGYQDPTILYGPGLATPGATDPTDPTLALLRGNGYNVVTWDPRGEFDSGGVFQVDNPNYEGRDVFAIIDWTAQQSGVELDSPGDPRMGMAGVSYGGGIQLVAASIDSNHVIDAITPVISWNYLPDSLYPSEAFKTSYNSLLLLGLVTTGARINPQIYTAMLTGALFGVLTPNQLAVFASSGPGTNVANISTPTLLTQGTVDVLFPLEQSIANAQYLTAAGTPTNMVWFCGGHGTCLTNPGDPTVVPASTLAWLDAYVKNKGQGDVPDIPKFQWVDQNGVEHSSNLLPFQDGFIGGSVDTHQQFSGTSGLLPIIPILGGSGPQTQVALPYSLGDGAPANNAVNVDIPAPADTTYVVGAPTLTMTYSGLGTSRHVYAQIVDRKTGLVVGNLVTPVPVTLDGREHTTTVPLSNIAYTMDHSSDLEVQIVSSATPFLNLTQWGYVNVSDVGVSLPTADPAQVDPDPLAAVPVGADEGQLVSV